MESSSAKSGFSSSGENASSGNASSQNAARQRGLGDDSSREIAARVSQLGDQSDSRPQFLRLLAGEVSDAFGSAMIALQSQDLHTDERAEPMMLVSNEQLGRLVAASEIRSLLKNASVVPVACEVQVAEAFRVEQAKIVEQAKTVAQTKTTKAGSEASHPIRGLRVEITSEPRRTALLLVYPMQQPPSVAMQVHDLKRLSCYVDSSRRVLDHRFSHEAIEPGLDSLGQIDGSDQNALSQANGSVAMSALSSPNQQYALRRSLQQFHRDLDLNASAHRIVNESRRILGCDRVTLLVYGNQRLRVQSISGVAVVDRRSNSVGAIELLSERLAVFARPIFVPADETLAPQVQTPLDDYMDESGVISLLALPLVSDDSHRGASRQGSSRSANEMIDVDHLDDLAADPFEAEGEMQGMLVLEYFSGLAPAHIDDTTRMVATEATLALRNSLEHHRVFGRGIGKVIGTAIRSWRSPLPMFLTAAAACLLLAGSLIQVDHHVSASGSVVPHVQRHVFADIDGRVKSVLVSDGQHVSAGDPLVELENAELELQSESISGELKTAGERLAAIEAVRLGAQADPSESPRLAIEEGQLRGELANLRVQQDLIRKQQETLVVRSPIDGAVVGWQLQRRLADRPVARGNVLVTVADPDGPWSLRLNVPDRDAGPVLQAVARKQTVPIQFSVATQPESSFSAELRSMATAARKDEFGELVIDATAVVSSESVGDEGTSVFQPDLARIGADVRARILCERRSVLHSWFGDVVDFVNRNVLFYFR